MPERRPRLSRRATCLGWIVFFVTTTAAATPPPAAPVNAGTDTGQSLRAPVERDEFSFVIFGDRTGGPRSGIEVLREAVVMTNRLGPAFVMTVGDLVEGYNEARKWFVQMQEYKGIMGRLDMPWYPVVGNHDVYDNPRTAGGHVELYKRHFGPLYYSFDYHWAHMICLFSDEKLSFSNPSVDQNMGIEQMQWLHDDLSATDARQIFVFLHHPRWNYAGCNWDDVHRILAEDGRVVAVIAGHIHTYRDDGVRDGIHYYTMATTGGHRNGLETASFDHVNLVRVRRDGIAMCALPVGSVHGSDVVLGTEVDVMRALTRGRWLQASGAVAIGMDQPTESTITVSVTNPTDRAIEYELEPKGLPSWTVAHPALAGTLPPGATATGDIAVAVPLLERGPRPQLLLQATLRYPLASGRVQLIRLGAEMPIELRGIERLARARPGRNRVLALDGESAVRVDLSPSIESLETFTLECWARGVAAPGRSALLTKTESSSFGIFWRDTDAATSRPIGYAHLRGHGYVKAAAPAAPAAWRWGAWTHLALVYDGQTLRLFVNGELASETRQAGRLSTNRFPLYVGADPDRRGQPNGFFTGEIDEVRLSSTPRYTRSFTPAFRHQRDGQTLLLLHMDTKVSGVLPDDSGAGNHGWVVGSPVLRDGRP